MKKLLSVFLAMALLLSLASHTVMATSEIAAGIPVHNPDLSEYVTDKAAEIPGNSAFLESEEPWGLEEAGDEMPGAAPARLPLPGSAYQSLGCQTVPGYGVNASAYTVKTNSTDYTDLIATVHVSHTSEGTYFLDGMLNVTVYYATELGGSWYPAGYASVRAKYGNANRTVKVPLLSAVSDKETLYLSAVYSFSLYGPVQPFGLGDMPVHPTDNGIKSVSVQGIKDDTELTRNTLAAWGFNGAVTEDVFYATDGLYKSSRIYAYIDRLMTTSNVSISGATYPGTMYCGNWYDSAYWLIRFATTGHKNIALTFASYGVAGAPRDFRIETDAGEVLTRFQSGNGNSAGKVTRVTLSLPASYNDQESAAIFIVQEGNVSVDGTTVKPGNASNSRLGDIIVSGDGVLPTSPALIDALSAWRFVSKDQFDASLTAFATDGVFSDSTLRIVGAGSGLALGTGSSEGQVYCTGWHNASDTVERSWTINTASTGYESIHVSFGARSSPKGPQNFALEIDCGEGWETVAQYTLVEALKTFSFDLPVTANDSPALGIRFRVLDTLSTDGTAVQSSGTSRLYNVVIRGERFLPDTGIQFEPHELTLTAQEGKSYEIHVNGSDLTNLAGTNFAITFDPAVLEAVDLCVFTWERELAPGPITATGITILLFKPGSIVFTVDEAIPNDSIWAGVLNTIRFRAIASGETALLVRDVEF